MREQGEDPKLFLVEQGWKFTEMGNQYVLACPLCAKDKHLYMNRITGLWDCKKCGEAGNIYQLKAKLGIENIRQAVELPKAVTPVDAAEIEKMHAALLADKEVMAYLTNERCFTTEAILALKLGQERKGGSRWIAFPWWQDRECWGIKYRIFPPDQREEDKRRFRRLPNYKSILYNIDSLKTGNLTILASGEPDAAALISMGFQCVVATTAGETAMLQEFVNALKAKEKIFILYDSDKTGLDSAKRIAKRIGFDKSYVVQLPKEVKDANDFLVKHGAKAKQELEAIMRRTKKIQVPTVYMMADVIDRVCEGWARPSSKTVSEITPWHAVNERIESLNGLVVLSAPQGTGKTTWGLNVAEHWAAKHGKPALFYCLEMTADELVIKILMAKYQRTQKELKSEWERYWIKALGDYNEVPLYVGSDYRLRGPEEIVELLRAAILRYELQLVVFDNVHVIGRKQDRRHEVSQFTLALKDLSMEFEVPIIAVAQPRKLEIGQIMSPWDLKESVDLFSDADQVIILHRQQIAPSKDSEVFDNGPVPTLYSPFTLMRLAKSRFSGPRDAVIYLEGEHHKFRDLESGELVEFKSGKGASKRRDWGVKRPEEWKR